MRGMVTYPYHCRDCAASFELDFESTEARLDAKPRCPKCSSTSVRVQFKAFANSAQATACLNGKHFGDETYPHPDFQISRKAPGLRRFTDKGVPIIESRQHEREIIAMSNGLLKRD